MTIVDHGIIVSPAKIASHPDYIIAKQRFEDAVVAANMARSLLCDLDMIAARRQDEWTAVITRLKGLSENASDAG